MKTIGLVGGAGWISTLEYYRIINEEVNRRLGGHEYAKCILYSLNYGEIESFNKTNDKEGVFSLVRDASVKVVNAGADCLVLCANTFHMYADRLKTEIKIPVIHVAEELSKEMKKKKIRKAGLLGTKLTMEMDFYKNKITEAGIEVCIPNMEERNFIQHSITNELLKGQIIETSKKRFLDICESLIAGGAEGIILGCTEIPLIIKQKDISVPVFNTLQLHALAAVDFALSTKS